MPAYSLNDYSLAGVLLKSDTEAWGMERTRENKISQNYTAIRPASEAKATRLIKSGIISMCLTLPQTQVPHDAFVSTHSQVVKSLIYEVAEITNWAVSATTPAFSELVLQDWHPEVVSNISLNEVDFLESEPDFMHLMHSSQFTVSVCIESIEEGKPEFYESDAITFIDEPFFI